MVKKILMITLTAAVLMGVPSISRAQNIKASVENDISAITISVNESVLRITGASGYTVQIFNVTGVSVAQIKIDSSDKRVELNLPKGCYILKVGKVVRKISIK